MNKRITLSFGGGKETVHGEKWFAWRPVKLKSGDWVWLESIWRTRNDFLCPAPNGIIKHWKG